MANLVLYRKYRPTTFGEIVGQEHIVQTLSNAVSNNLISHAYLFSGPRGSGKTSMARVLAKAVNCTDLKNGEPCNTCESCVEIKEGRAMDFIEIDAASNRGIDEIRDLKEAVRFAPTKLKYKVYVIDESHQLTKEAANALLKTLEEPPDHAIFILATTEAHRMIPTIASRCQRFDFKTHTVSEITDRLLEIVKKEGTKIDKEAVTLIAASSGGSLRDATSLLDKVLTFQSGSDTIEAVSKETVRDLLGLIDLNIISQFVDFLCEKKTSEAIAFLHKQLQDGLDPIEFASHTVSYLRSLLILKINPDMDKALEQGLTPEQQEKAKQQAQTFEGAHLAQTIKNFMEQEEGMKSASIIQLPLELAIIDSCRIV